MKWRVPDQEVDQRKLGQRFAEKTVMNVTGRMLCIVINGRSR